MCLALLSAHNLPSCSLSVKGIVGVADANVSAALLSYFSGTALPESTGCYPQTGVGCTACLRDTLASCLSFAHAMPWSWRCTSGIGNLHQYALAFLALSCVEYFWHPGHGLCFCHLTTARVSGTHPQHAITACASCTWPLHVFLARRPCMQFSYLATAYISNCQ